MLKKQMKNYKEKTEYLVAMFHHWEILISEQ